MDDQWIPCVPPPCPDAEEVEFEATVMRCTCNDFAPDETCERGGPHGISLTRGGCPCGAYRVVFHGGRMVPRPNRYAVFAEQFTGPIESGCWVWP